MNLLDLLAGTYQLAYVTADLDRAVAHLKEHYGAHDVLLLDKMEMKNARFRGEPETWTSRVAQTMTGDLNVEIIEPLSGAAVEEVFRPFVSEDRLLTLHHVAAVVGESRDDWERIEEALARQGHPFVIAGEVEGMGTLGYLDLTGTLGHYVELNYLPEDARDYADKLATRDADLERLGTWI